MSDSSIISTVTHNTNNLAHRQFGHWTVLDRPPIGPNRPLKVWCRCVCGTEKPVYVSNLISSKSCGCGCLRKNRYVHGMTKTRIYAIWSNIITRCYNETDSHYPRWGGRGITVCGRWRESFENFYEDMGPTYHDELMIERISNHGPYCKENCRWATNLEQSNNRRNNVHVTFGDETHTIAEWARKLNINYGTLQSRISVYGWPLEKALTAPIKTHHRHHS